MQASQTCKTKYSASAIIPKKLNPSKGEKHETRVVGVAVPILFQTFPPSMNFILLVLVLMPRILYCK